MPIAPFDDEYFMRQALQEAQQAFDENEIPVGAVVVHKNRVIAKSHNLTETLTDVTAHAEMQVITSAANFIGAKFLTNCTVYITLEPCVMCAGALVWARPKRVVFAAKDNKKGFLTVQKNQLHKKTEITSGVLAKDCSSLLWLFFEKKRME